MKYIRTFAYNEDSVFEVIEEYEKTIKCKLTNCENGYIVLGKNCVVKQADTIEELCDEFVLALKDSKKNVNDNMYDKEEYYDLYRHIGYAKNYYNEDYHDLYGAIWTSKGLIYVAKMNEEGELELI